MKITAKTDIGLVRSTNEDTYTFIKKDDNNFLAFVCDGMGGHLGGSFASAKAVEMINEAFNNFANKKSTKSIGVWLFDAITKINAFIYEQSINQDNLKGMGTTITGVIKLNNEMYYAHIGDSRIYIYNKDELRQITTDHTYVNTLLLNGLITYKQALKHPKKHVLTNALGIKKSVSVDIGQISLKDDDNLLICSDGLHNLLDGKKLLKALNEPLEIEDKINSIINKALDLGGNDNITLILLEH
ncbi:MAG: Stp1/IreP family PP2C-type Ser/Thr phosphatase [Bacilli bacterium]|nr:Stp1/IreP family PP2C-type Ser/Thr phosphatase [Bacilli bacterium]